MAAPGKFLSLKGKAATWSGIDRRSLYSPLPGQFRELTNGYVSSDGTEVCRMPGWVRIAEPRNNESKAINAASVAYPTTVTTATDVLVQKGDFVRVADHVSTASINGDWLVSGPDLPANNTTFQVPINVTVDTTPVSGTVTVHRQRHNHRFRQIQGFLAVAGECSYSRRTVIGVTGTTRIIELVDNGNGTWTIVFDRPHGYDIGTTFSINHDALDDATGVGVGWYKTNVAADPNETVWAAGSANCTSTGPFTATVATALPTGISNVRSASATDMTIMVARTNLPTCLVKDSLPTLGTVLTGFDVFNAPARYYWTTGASTYPTEVAIGAVNGTPNEFLMGFVRRKGRCELANGRVLFTVPGYGLVWECDLLTYRKGLRPKLTTSLGVPRGRIVAASETAAGAGAFPNGTWYVAVAYRLRDTNDIGLFSPTIAVTVAGTFQISVEYVNPHYVQPELYGEVDVLFFAGLSDSSMQLCAIGQHTWGLDVLSYQRNIAGFTTGATVDIRRPFKNLFIEQQPMGCIDTGTVRGFTTFGGSPGFDFDDPALTRLYLILQTGAILGNESAIWRSLFVGGQFLPSGYLGTDLINVPLATLATVDSARTATVSFWKDLAFTLALGPAGPPPARTSVLDQIQVDLMTATAAAADNLRSSRFELPRGHIWTSEAGHPEISNSEGRAITDSVWGEDVEAVGRYQDQFVVCTRKETYLWAFGRSPLGSDPQRVSDRYGAISPIVEFDDGAAWLSDLGPVAMLGGQVHWIGEPVFDLFKTAKRDSRGLMWHSCLGYDRQRQLVYFGLRKDIYDIQAAAIVDISSGDVPLVTFSSSLNVPIGRRIFVRFAGTASAPVLDGIRTAEVLSPTTMRVWMPATVVGSATDQGTATSGYDFWTGDDDNKSKVGCDYFLVWSVRTGSWSVWQPPAHLGDIHDMWPIRFTDGVERLCFLAHHPMDAAIYAFDDGYLDTVQFSGLVTGTVDAAELGAKSYFQSATPIGTGTATRIGMGFVVKSSDGGTLRGYGHILRIDSDVKVSFGTMATPLGSQTLTLQAGDKIEIGMIHMRAVTQRMSVLANDWESPAALRSVLSRHELETTHTSTPDAWMVPYAASADGGTSTVAFEAAKLGSMPSAARTRSKAGLSTVREHQITTDFVGGLRARVKDILLEVSD